MAFARASSEPPSRSGPGGAAPPDATSPGSAALTALVADLRGRGRDARGVVGIELDGTGRAVGVEVTSTAMEGNRGSMERAIREALDAAWADLDAARRERAPQIAAAAAQNVGDLTVQARTFAEAANTQLERALRAVAQAASRAEGGER